MNLRLLLASVLATALVSSSASAAPTVTISSPSQAGTGEDGIFVNVTATDAMFAMSGVTASIGGASTALTPGAAGAWSGSVDISALPVGPFTLTINATNANAESTTVTKAMIRSHWPLLALTTLSQSVANPNLTVNATCTALAGSYPCAKIEVSYLPAQANAIVIASSAGAAMNSPVSLAAYEGKKIRLQVVATDGAGVQSNTGNYLDVFVESSPNLGKLDEVAGVILDADATRIVYDDPSAGLMLKNRSDGTLTSITAEHVPKAFLFSGGVAYPSGTWRAGVITPRTTHTTVIVGSTDFYVTGDWAAWWDGTTIKRENLGTGVVDQRGTTDIPMAEAGFYYPRVAVDGTGNIAYVKVPKSGTAALHYVSATTGIDTTVTTTFLEPLVDGEHVAARHFSGPQHSPTYLWTASTNTTEMLETVFGPVNSPISAPGTEYRFANGWLAYTKTIANQIQAWTRSPAGVDALASPYIDVRLAGLNDQGEIAVDSASGRAISVAATPPKPALSVGGSNGTMKYFAGDWYSMKGRVLLKAGAGLGAVDAGADADGGDDAGGVSEAGADDGGSSSSSSGGSSSSGSSSSGSSSSGSSSGGSAGTPPTGDDGGCTTSGGGAGSGASALVLGAALTFALRRRRAASHRTMR